MWRGWLSQAISCRKSIIMQPTRNRRPRDAASFRKEGESAARSNASSTEVPQREMQPMEQRKDAPCS